MNAPAERQQDRSIVPTSPRRQTKAEQVAKSLTHIRENLLPPFSALQAVTRGVPSADSQGERVVAMFLRPSTIRQPTTDADREMMLTRVEQPLLSQPETDFVRAELDKVETAATAAFDLRQTRFMIGLMIDAFPNARPHDPGSYLETVIDMVRGEEPSPAVVAKACDDIKRSCKFPPAASEVLEKVVEAKRALASFIAIAGRFLAMADHVSVQMDWLKQVPLFDETSGEDRLRPPAEPSRDPASSPPSGRVNWV